MSTAKTLFDASMKGLKKHWPKIAVGVGSAFLLAGGYLLGREVPKYKKEVADKEAASGEKLKGKEKAKVIAKHFAGPTCAIVGGSLFVAASVCENSRRAKIGATACAISEMTSGNLVSYKEAAKEIIGEEKEKEVQKKADEKKLEQAPPIPYKMVPDGMFWCYDIAFGTEPFLTDLNTLRRVETDIYDELAHADYGDSITMNEIYERLGKTQQSKNDDAKFLENFGYINDDKLEHRRACFNIASTVKYPEGLPVFTIKPNAVILDPDQFEMSTLI